MRQAKGFTPLQEAALLGRRDLVDLLLEHGAEINSRADDGRTVAAAGCHGTTTSVGSSLNRYTGTRTRARHPIW